MWQYNKTEELYHHGVLGMKWGVRRYQNADGSLTPAGRRKAKKLAKQYADVTGKKLIVKKKAVKEEQPKSIKEMSDAELQQKINRFNLEKTYMKMLASEAPKQQTSKGKKFVQSLGRDVVTPAMKDAGRTVLGNWLKKVGNDYVYKKNPTEYDKLKNEVGKLELEARKVKAKNTIKNETNKLNKVNNINDARQQLWKSIESNKHDDKAINEAIKQFRQETERLNKKKTK